MHLQYREDKRLTHVQTPKMHFTATELNTAQATAGTWLQFSSDAWYL